MDKAFQKKLEELANGKSLYDVWSDFVTVSAISIANSVCFQQEREDTWKQIMKRYGKQGTRDLAKLLAMTAEAFEKNPCQDYLGAMYMELGFGNQYLGQFFTPYHLAEALVKLSLPDKDSRPYTTVYDPCCGSGVMLIAAFHRMMQLEKDPQTQLMCAGQDLSFVVAMMCYIQISLLGIAGYVAVGDSLTHPLEGPPLFAPKGAWCTPLYFHPIWTWRRAYDLLNGEVKREINLKGDIDGEHRYNQI